MSLVVRSVARFDAVRDAARTSLWPVPVLAVVGALVAGVGLPRLDRTVDQALPAWLGTVLFGGGPSAARAVLEAVASSLITVTSLTFSLTVVTLQLASSQFSPRLLRTFTRDRFVHVTLAVFLATFTYALTVLRTVRSVQDDGVAFVPQLAVSTAFVLAIVSVLTLVLFLAHLAKEIRVETMLRRVRDDASQAADGGDPSGDTTARRPTAAVLAAFEPPSGALTLIAAGSGFVLHVEERMLVKAAERLHSVLRIDVEPGRWVIAGTPVGNCWLGEPGADPEGMEQLAEVVQDAITLGPERTAMQDLAFGLRQLADVSTKALSPGINDPTTAVHAIAHASALLCEIAAKRPGPLALVSEQGDADHPALLLARSTFAELLEIVVAPACRYGHEDVDVLARVLTLLREVAWLGPRRWAGAQSPDVPDDPTGAAVRAAVRQQLSRVREVVAASDLLDGDVQVLRELESRVEDALDGRW